MEPAITLKAIANATKSRQHIVKPTPYLYYCRCGRLSLVLDCRFECLPIRSVDGSHVINGTQRTFQVDVDKGSVAYIKRDDTEYEKQYRYNCKLCKMPLFYKHYQNSHVTFVIKHALMMRRKRKTRKAINNNKPTTGPTVVYQTSPPTHEDEGTSKKQIIPSVRFADI